MILAKNQKELAQALETFGTQDIGFVPTMGALHEGHLSLVDQSLAHRKRTVMSIFVNPAQFGPQEDLDAYPRPFEKDMELAKSRGVDLLFSPEVSEMYGRPDSIRITENHFSRDLCGKYRKGHFDGVCTIVAKLLLLIQPSHLYLGNKDAQQVRVLEKMCQDLFFSTKVIGVPTVREESGLAMSSRNQYLSTEEKHLAAQLYQALSKAKDIFVEGERNSEVILSVARKHLDAFPDINLQYIELLQWEDFSKPERVQKKSLLALAAFLGKTRLIDNVFLDPYSNDQ
ncbi:MAG: pantoate--beta-alanine ligase [Bdellovibrionales bacterium]|nr:pantoate--beta-alanine ligase [Bdellovibrionales bacterium]